jgi:hypothetical protein
MKNFIVMLSVLLLFSYCEKKEQPLPKVEEPVKVVVPTVEKKLDCKVLFFIGKVTITRDNVNVPPENGMDILATDIIQTGSPGSVELMLGDAGAIKITKNSQVSVARILDTGKEKTKVDIDYGKVFSVVSKSKKDQEFSVTTPTALAGVRGTSFLTIVESKQKQRKESSAKVPCVGDGCKVKIVVIDGMVGITKKDSKDEIVLDKHKQLTIKDEKKLTSEMIKPMSDKSAEEIKDLLVFHKSENMGFTALEDELRSFSVELDKYKTSSIEETKTAVKKREADKNMSEEVFKDAGKAEDEKYLKKEIHKDKLKMNRKGDN